MQLLIDCTSTHASGLNTGIQRVVRNYARHALALAPAMGMTARAVIFRDGQLLPLNSADDLVPRAHPRSVRDTLNQAYGEFARRLAAWLPVPAFQRFVLAHRSQFGLAWLLFLPFALLARVRRRFVQHPAAPAGLEHTFSRGDIFLLPDASWISVSESILSNAKEQGVALVFVIHDIIPITHPQFFATAHGDRFREWFLSILDVADLFIYDSGYTQQTVEDFVSTQAGRRLPPGAVAYLGCDHAALPTGTVQHVSLRNALARQPRSCLVVGTLEPRKNLHVVLDAFERLWRRGTAVSLILIGRVGWLCEDLLDRIRSHAEFGQHLFWFDDVGDADLALAYRQASALIFPSLVEGFGLPLVEALGHGLPVIASDIPVFREVVGDHARFFPAHDPAALEAAILEKLAGSPERQPLRWLTWEQSTRQLLLILQNFSQSRSAAT